MLLCVATNGLNVALYADELAQLRVSHVTLTVNAVEPRIGQQVYAWVRDGRDVYRGEAAAGLLWERQQDGIRRLKARDLVVKINTILIPGINDRHIDEVARTIRNLGADILNCVPMYPVADTPLAEVPEPSPQMVAEARSQAGQYLPLMHHCTRCRADACGLLGDVPSDDQHARLRQAAAQPLVPTEDRPCVAVATLEGMLVNQHLGEADRLQVYRQQAEGFELVATRTAPRLATENSAGSDWRNCCTIAAHCWSPARFRTGRRTRPTRDPRGHDGRADRRGLGGSVCRPFVTGTAARKHHCDAGVTCAGNGQGCL